eukprot:Awhi_evm2s2884
MMKSAFSLIAVVAAVVSAQEATIGGERPDDVPRLLHYQQNMGCDTVAFVSKLNSADPGVQTATSNFFRLPIEQVAGSLDVSVERAEELRDGLPLNIVRANKDQGQCLKQCGL